jgi:nitrogen fixation NifU-like protein
MQLDSLYQEVILDHYKHPQHKGLATTYDAQVHHVNPSCGDEITLNVTLKGDTVAAITWDGVGCSISQASVSILSDLLLGKSISEAELILNNFTELMQSKGTMAGDDAILEDAVAMAGVSKFPARIKCALLGWMAYKDAVVQAQAKL